MTEQLKLYFLQQQHKRNVFNMNFPIIYFLKSQHNDMEVFLA